MVRKIDNSISNNNPVEAQLLHGDFSTFETNLATKSGGEIISPDCAKSIATYARGIQDTNAKLLIKSLNDRLQETELPEHEPAKNAQYNPKEITVD